MPKAKNLQHEGEWVAASLKAVLLISAIGIVVSVFVAVRAPQIFVAPDEPIVRTAEVPPSVAGAPVAAQDAPTPTTGSDQPNLQATARSDYFPARSGAPQSAPGLRANVLGQLRVAAGDRAALDAAHADVFDFDVLVDAVFRPFAAES